MFSFGYGDFADDPVKYSAVNSRLLEVSANQSYGTYAAFAYLQASGEDMFRDHMELQIFLRKEFVKIPVPP